MKYKVFISYRHSDCRERAEIIRLYLTENFSNDSIFIDHEDIHSGPFPEYIKRALDEVEYFVLLVSASSFNTPKKHNETDYYYEEIRHVLNRESRPTIIPIVYDGVKFDKDSIPEEFEELSEDNAIIPIPESPQYLKNKLVDFTKKRKNVIGDWIKLPLAIFTTYAIITFLSGLGMWIHDNCFITEEGAIEIACDYIIPLDDVFVYPISKRETIIYYPKTDNISYGFSTENGANIKIDNQDLLSVGFWSTATTLAYQITRNHYKPHGGKAIIAYAGMCVAIVAGVGLGFTFERMIFPIHQCRAIRKHADLPSFWHAVINKKYKHPQPASTSWEKL